MAATTPEDWLDDTVTLHRFPWHGQAVDLVLDEGESRYARPSTVVKLNGGGYDVLREGVIDVRMLQRIGSLTVLFVCSGNTWDPNLPTYPGEFTGETMHSVRYKHARGRRQRWHDGHFPVEWYDA